MRRDYEAYKAYNVSLAEDGYNKTSKVAMEAAHSVLKSLLQTSELYEKFLSSGSQGAAWTIVIYTLGSVTLKRV